MRWARLPWRGWPWYAVGSPALERMAMVCGWLACPGEGHVVGLPALERAMWLVCLPWRGPYVVGLPALERAICGWLACPGEGHMWLACLPWRGPCGWSACLGEGHGMWSARLPWRGWPWYVLACLPWRKSIVWLLTRESPRNFGWTFSPPNPCCARAAVPRGRWVYERRTSVAPRKKTTKVWLLTRESPGNLGWTFSPPNPCCARAAVPRGRWVYERGTSVAPQKKNQVWLLIRESPRNFGWTFSPPVSRRARVVVPRGRWVYKRGSSETPFESGCSRVSRQAKSVGLSRHPSPAAHESSCREVGGYMKEEHRVARSLAGTMAGSTAHVCPAGVVKYHPGVIPYHALSPPRIVC